MFILNKDVWEMTTPKNETNDCFEISIYHQKISGNYHYCNITLAGIYISVIKIKMTESNGFISKEFDLFGDSQNYKLMILPLERKSSKKTSLIADKFGSLFKELNKESTSGEIWKIILENKDN